MPEANAPAPKTVGSTLSSIEPGKISAWLGLGGAVGSGLAGFAADVGSVYSPVDTAAFFLFIGVFAAYIIGFAGLIAGALVLMVVEQFSPVISDTAGAFILIASVAIVAVLIGPAFYDSAVNTVQDEDVSFIGGIGGVRIAAVLILVGAGYLWYRFLGPGRTQVTPRG